MASQVEPEELKSPANKPSPAATSAPFPPTASFPAQLKAGGDTGIASGATVSSGLPFSPFDSGVNDKQLAATQGDQPASLPLGAQEPVKPMTTTALPSNGYRRVTRRIVQVRPVAHMSAHSVRIQSQPRTRTVLIAAIAAVSTALLLCIIALVIFLVSNNDNLSGSAITEPALPEGAVAANEAAREGIASGNFNSVWVGNEQTTPEIATIIRDAFVVEFVRTGSTNMDLAIKVAQSGTDEYLHCQDSGKLVTCSSDNGYLVYIA